jgi:hypothetical protein
MLYAVGHTTSILDLLAPKVVCRHGTGIDLLAEAIFAGERDLCNSPYASHTKTVVSSINDVLRAFSCSEASSVRKCI